MHRRSVLEVCEEKQSHFMNVNNGANTRTVYIGSMVATNIKSGYIYF